MTEKYAHVSDTVPAIEGEAERALNDTFPGDPYPISAILSGIRQRAVQAIGAGISRRDWHSTETAYNSLRDGLDNLIGRLDRAPDASRELNQTKSVLAATREHVQRLETQRDEMLKALKGAETAIDDCQTYRSHLHHEELAQVRAAIAAAIRT